MNKKYEVLVNNVIDLVGGKDNISYFAHCATRLRFNIKDSGLVNTKKIEETQGVVGTQWAGEQLQLIIGTSVEEVYNEINKRHSLAEGQNKVDLIKSGKEKFSVKGVISNFFSFLSGSMTEILPVLIGAGMINVILVVLTTFHLISTDTSTYKILSFVSNAAFYFLPVFVGGTSAKRLGMNQWLGMFLGAVLIHPDFVAMVGSENPITLFGLPVHAVAYSSTFFPILITNFVASYIYKFATKVCPEILKSMLVPLITIIVTVPLMFVALAPAGSYVGVFVASSLVWLYNTVGFVGLAVIGFFFPLIVTTGMQHAFGPYLFQSLASFGYEAIMFPVTYVNNVNQGIGALAVSIKTKNKNFKSTAASASVTALLAGITEPALFGISLRYRTVLISTMIGNAVGMAFAGFLHVVGFTFVGSFGLLGLAAFIGDRPNNLLNICISIAVGSIVTFVLSFILYKDKNEQI